MVWRTHFRSAPDVIFAKLTTDEGRASFWAESARQVHERIEFQFPDGTRCDARILDSDPPRRFALEYFNAKTVFELSPDGCGGTDLTLIATGVPEHEHCEVLAGWVSVLLALKASADFGVDLRNHDATRTWAVGFAEN
jgi:uncharacterized protein YndB with AHSA1/START domain